MTARGGWRVGDRKTEREGLFPRWLKSPHLGPQSANCLCQRKRICRCHHAMRSNNLISCRIISRENKALCQLPQHSSTTETLLSKIKSTVASPPHPPPSHLTLSPPRQKTHNNSLKHIELIVLKGLHLQSVITVISNRSFQQRTRRDNCFLLFLSAVFDRCVLHLGIFLALKPFHFSSSAFLTPWKRAENKLSLIHI